MRPLPRNIKCKGVFTFDHTAFYRVFREILGGFFVEYGDHCGFVDIQGSSNGARFPSRLLRFDASAPTCCQFFNNLVAGLTVIHKLGIAAVA